MLQSLQLSMLNIWVREAVVTNLTDLFRAHHYNSILGQITQHQPLYKPTTGKAAHTWVQVEITLPFSPLFTVRMSLSAHVLIGSRHRSLFIPHIPGSAPYLSESPVTPLFVSLENIFVVPIKPDRSFATTADSLLVPNTRIRISCKICKFIRLFNIQVFSTYMSQRETKLVSNT